MRRRDFLGGGGYSVARVFFIPFPFVFPSVVPVARYSVVPVARWRGIPVARRLVASSPRSVLDPSPRWRGIPIRPLDLAIRVSPRCLVCLGSCRSVSERCPLAAPSLPLGHDTPTRQPKAARHTRPNGRSRCLVSPRRLGYATPCHISETCQVRIPVV